ncbi:MAG: sugar ABC transporter permease [Spirochaetaceae bacterium]|nr:MAG: sugar ABC transporter permease [Spirochaetaceae bacterium]
MRIGRKPATGYLYILPLIVLVAVFSVYPTLNVLWMSVHEIALSNLREAKFIGIQNYLVLFKTTNPPLGRILWLTFTFVFVSVIFHVVLGFTLANLLNISWVRGKNTWRNLFMISWVAASIIIGYTFRFLFEPRSGILNHLMRLLHLPTQAWAADPQLALPVIIVVNIWRGVPYSLIIQTAGLQSVNTELYDAAVVDGANALQILSRIKIPLVKEFLLLDIILDTTDTFQVFETILAITGGGPLHKTETIALYMYHQAFRFGEVGKGSGIGVVLLLISLVFAVIYIKFFKPTRDVL